MQSPLMRSGFLSSVASSLIVTERDAVYQGLAAALSKEGFALDRARDPDDAINRLRVQWIDAVLIDGDLEGQNAYSLCRAIRKDPDIWSVLITVLTDGKDPEQIVEAYHAGADDHALLHTDPALLSAQIKSLLRRQAALRDPRGVAEPGERSEVLKAGLLMIWPDNYQVTLAGEELRLTLTEFRMLCLLASKPGKVFDRETISTRLHGELADVTDRAVDTRISVLRKKLGDYAWYIRSVRGIGYTFDVRPPAQGTSAANP